MTTSTKNVAYVAVNGFENGWGVSICVEGESGHRPLSDYSGPYIEDRAKGIAVRLNSRLGIDKTEARRIVLSTMKSSLPGSSAHASAKGSAR